jgi:hypothetical protein
MDHLTLRPGPAAKLRVLVVLEGLADFFTAVHYEGAMLNHWLADGPSLKDILHGDGCKRGRAPEPATENPGQTPT